MAKFHERVDNRIVYFWGRVCAAVFAAAGMYAYRRDQAETLIVVDGERRET